MSSNLEDILRDQFKENILEFDASRPIPEVRVNKEVLPEVCRLLHGDEALKYEYLTDITSIDWKDRFEIIYRLMNMHSFDAVVLRVDLDSENPQIGSVCDIWKGANFQEREVYDLMGVVFDGHPELERILLPKDWEGYPLRKNYVIPD